MPNESTLPFSNAQLTSEIQSLSTPAQRTLLSLLAICQKHELPASGLLESFSHDLPRTPLERRRRTRGFYWSRVLDFSRTVDDGSTVYENLSSYPKLLQPFAELAMKWKCHNGDHNAMADSWLGRPPDLYADKPDRKSSLNPVLSVLFKLLIVIQLVVFIAMQIFPMFASILSEFAIEPPASFRLADTILNYCLKFWFIPVLLTLLLIPFLFPAIRRYCRRWNPFAWKTKPSTSSTINRQVLAIEIERQAAGDLQTMDATNADTDAHSHQTIRWQELIGRKVITRREVEILDDGVSTDVQSWLLRSSTRSRDLSRDSKNFFYSRTFVTLANVIVVAAVVLLAIVIFSTMIAILTELI